MKALFKFVFKTLFWSSIGFLTLAWVVSSNIPGTMQKASQSYYGTR